MDRPSPKPPSRWRTYSLRGLLLAITLIAFVLGWIFVPLERRRNAYTVLYKNHASISYAANELPTSMTPREKWLKRIFPLEYFRDSLSIMLHSATADEKTMEAISALPETRELSLDRDGMRDNGLRYLSRFHQLKKLRLQNAWLDDHSLESLRGNRTMHTFELRGGTVSPDVFAPLSDHPKLDTVVIQDVPLGEATLNPLARCPNLALLTLVDTGLTPRQLGQLAELSATEVHIVQRGVTDDLVPRFAAVRGLKELDLRKSKVSDAAIPALATMTTLTKLDLRETRVTSKGADELRRLLPKTTVDWGWDPQDGRERSSVVPLSPR